MAPNGTKHQLKSVNKPVPVVTGEETEVGTLAKKVGNEIKITGVFGYDEEEKIWCFKGKWVFCAQIGAQPSAFSYSLSSRPSSLENRSNNIAKDKTSIDDIPDVSQWSGSFVNVVRKRKSISLQNVNEQFEMRLKPQPQPQPQNDNLSSSIDDEYIIVAQGRNRFGQFKMVGSLSRTTGKFDGVKNYIRFTSAIPKTNVRHSKRTRVPNRMLMEGFESTQVKKKARTPRTQSNCKSDALVSECTVQKQPFDRAFVKVEKIPFKKERARRKIRNFLQSISESVERENRERASKAKRTSDSGGGKRQRRELSKKEQKKINEKLMRLIAGWNSVTGQYASQDGVLKHGEVYKGLSKGAERNGYGVCAFANGHVYEGEWFRGKMHGKGVITDSSGALVYQGEFVQGQTTGIGTHFFLNGDRYDGEIRDGKFNGFGAYSEVSGKTYIGEWNMGRRNGLGKMTLEDGSFYDGEWLNDVPHGRGFLEIVNLTCYDGNWIDGKMEGKGTCTFTGMGRYEGNFKSGLKDGRGTYKFAPGVVYEGRFRRDNIEGSGFLKMEKDIPIQLHEDQLYLPINCQAQMRFIHLKAGFCEDGS